MTIIESIPITYVVTASNKSAGVQVVILPGDREAPAYWGDGNNTFSITLHEDGSPCTTDCGCVPGADRTRIGGGETVVIGEWTWVGERSWATGWRCTGLSTAELRLEARVDELAEDLAGEKILHDLTREDVVARDAEIESLQERRGKIRASLRRSRAAAADAESRFGLAFQAAWAGWSVAILIAALWISAVIA